MVINKHSLWLQKSVMAGAVVQYVIVRGDLLSQLGWPVGALIAQACHACTAVTHMYHEDEHMKAYLSDLDNMRKVVLEVHTNWFSYDKFT